MSNSSARILVVEQDDLIRELLVEILTSNGFRTMSTDHCPSPDVVRQLRPGAMVIDPFVGSGTLPGWEYVRLLRSHAGLRALPIVLCTSAHEKLRDITAEDLEMIAGAVMKPFDLDELLDAVMTATGSGERTSPFPWIAASEPVRLDSPE